MDFQSGVDDIGVSSKEANSATATNDAFTDIVAAFTMAGRQIKKTQVGSNLLVELNTDTAAEFSIMTKNKTAASLLITDFIL